MAGNTTDVNAEVVFKITNLNDSNDIFVPQAGFMGSPDNIILVAARTRVAVSTLAVMGPYTIMSAQVSVENTQSVETKVLNDKNESLSTQQVSLRRI